MKAEEKQVTGHSTSARKTQTVSKDSTTLPAPAPVHGVLIGTLIELSEEGQARVNFPGNLAVLPVAARSTTALTSEALGREVALLFENGDTNRPIIIGILHQSASTETDHERSPAATEHDAEDENKPPTAIDEKMTPAESELIIDGRKIDLQAREQIVLRCGKSSITMTSAGKVIIRGAYVSSKSSGANRIKGGSVQIN